MSTASRSATTPSDLPPAYPYQPSWWPSDILGPYPGPLPRNEIERICSAQLSDRQKVACITVAQADLALAGAEL